MNFLGGIIQLQRNTTNYMSCAVVFGEALLTLRSQIGGTERSGKISYSTISVSRITYEAMVSCDPLTVERCRAAA